MIFFFISLRLYNVNSMSEECTNEWNKVYASNTDLSIPDDYRLMYQYSGFAINQLGNYDECNDIDIARYAVVMFYEHPRIVQTYCGPIVCTKQDYYDMIGSSTISPDYEIIFVHLYQNKHIRDYDSGAIVMIVLCSILGFLGALATLLDYILSNEQKETTFLKYLLSFSIIANGKKLLVSKAVEKVGKKDTLEVLEGIRSLSYFWIMFGHVNTIFQYNAVLSNYNTLTEEYKKWFYILEYGFIYAVDPFFWISGFLMAYFLIAEIEKSKSFSPSKLGLHYLHRYLRITPAYAFVLFFFFYLQEYLGRGPMFYHIKDILEDCHDYWYTALIYLNNFIPDYKGNLCIGVTWYLADEMQFSIIGPLVIILYVQTRKEIGWMLILGLCVLTMVTGGVLSNYFNAQIAFFYQPFHFFDDYMWYMYKKPYTRVAPYALGMAGGLIVYSYKKFKETNQVYDKFALWLAQIQENVYIRITLFLVGIGCLNIILLVKYHAFRHPGDNDDYSYMSQAQNNTFFIFERTTYAMGLTLIFLPLLLGHFSLIFEMLTGKIWSFISRFTFVMFMIHVSIIEVAAYSQKTAITFDIYNHLTWWLAFIPIVFLCALPIVLLVELPALNLEKLIFASPQPKAVKQEKDAQPLIGSN